MEPRCSGVCVNLCGTYSNSGKSVYGSVTALPMRVLHSALGYSSNRSIFTVTYESYELAHAFVKPRGRGGSVACGGIASGWHAVYLYRDCTRLPPWEVSGT